MTHGAGQPPGRAGHEGDRDIVDKDVGARPDVTREGEFTDHDVEVDEPTSEREGDYTDADVTDDDTDTPPSSYVAKDVPG